MKKKLKDAILKSADYSLTISLTDLARRFEFPEICFERCRELDKARYLKSALQEPSKELPAE